ncbi:hypothetical protein GGR54DRAFT_648920 [Hypoxylon sp. NC1633]|nr:hypothetical protein GGR54DRAFT_648920 [Hypoxylon sp. NC1633]
MAAPSTPKKETTAEGNEPTPVTPGGHDLKFFASTPTGSDQKFFAAIFKNLPKNVDIDWDAFARDMELKDGKIAKMRLGQIRRKLDIRSPGSNGSQPFSPSKVTKSKPRVRAPKPKKGKGFIMLEDKDVMKDEDHEEEKKVKSEENKEELGNDGDHDIHQDRKSYLL